MINILITIKAGDNYIHYSYIERKATQEMHENRKQ